MAGANGKRRLLLLLPVLAGLFLMHGITGGGAGTASCHDMPLPAMVMASAHEAHAHVHHDAHAMNATLTPAHPMSGHVQTGETCTPLRPEGLADLFLSPVLIVAATGSWPRLPFGVRLIRPHWPNGPPRTGVQVLNLLSISRT